MNTSRTSIRRTWWVILLLTGLAGAAVLAWRQTTRLRAPAENRREQPDTVAGENAAESNVTWQGDERGYITSAVCKKCHETEHASWHASYHRTMTQPATPQTVVAPLDGTQLESYGRQYDFARRGDKFFVTMTSPEWEQSIAAAGAKLDEVASGPREEREIVQLTGSHHLQTFWVEGKDGLRQVPWYWHIQEECWIPSEDSFLRPPDAGRMFDLWDAVCIKCHVVGGVPGYNFRGRFDSRIVEMGIACEACHGPGAKHVAQHQATGKPAARQRSTGAGTQTAEAIVNPARQSHEVASQICAQCHSSTRPIDRRQWLTEGSSYRPGYDFLEHFRVVDFHDPPPEDEYYIDGGYWADGTCRTGGDEYQGLIASACHLQGELSCLSCHSLHQYAERDDQLRPGMEGNDACLQCHQEYEGKLTEHTHHAAGSSGSLCYNCHMPHVTYALFKGIRSHRIDSPSAAVSARTGRPNACNLCHLDRTLDWADRNLAEWYGPETTPAPLSEEDRTVAASVRWLLAGDAAQRVIAAWHIGWPAAQEASGKDWQAALLAYALDDPYAAVRFVAGRSLRSLPGFEEFPLEVQNTPDERLQRIDRVLEMWREASPDGESRPEVLIDEQGELRAEAVKSLQQSRDNRPVNIPE